MVISDHSHAGQGETQEVQFEEKKKTKKCNVGAKPYAQGDETLQENLDAEWNKESGSLRPRFHPGILQPVEGKA